MTKGDDEGVVIEGHGGDFGEVVADFLNFGAGDFPVKIPFKKCFKIEFFFGGGFGAEIRFWSCKF